MSLTFYLTCPCCKTSVFDRNITHNLGKMAAIADIYNALWRSRGGDSTDSEQYIDYKTAENLIEPLTIGLQKLKTDPEHFKEFDSPNGWGVYEHFIPFVEAILEACKKYPNCVPYSSV